MSNPKLAMEVWYDPENAKVIQLSTDDERLTDDAGAHKGIMIGVNEDKKPKTFHYLDLLLQRAGVPRP